MKLYSDAPEGLFYAGIITVLLIASLVALLLRRRSVEAQNPRFVDEILSRMNTWWFMAVLFLSALSLGFIATLLLFLFISFLALREFITIVPTHRADHRALIWAFLVICPLQYFFVGMAWHALYATFIPIYAFLFVPTRMVAAGDCEDFLERAAKTQWGLMICVFLVSHAPALLTLTLPGYANMFILLCYLVLLTQLSDVLQFYFSELLGRHQVAPNVSPQKTWEGLAGALLSVTVIGMLLAPVTPFFWWQSAFLSFAIAICGFFGSLTMSAIKRDSGIKEYGTLIAGNVGILDRIDSLIFASPVFFHVVKYFFAI